MPTHQSVSMSRRWPCSSIRLMFSHGNFDSWQCTPGRPEWSLQVLVGRVSISAAAMWAAYKLQLYSIHQHKSVYILLVFMGISVIQKVPNRAVEPVIQCNSHPVMTIIIQLGLHMLCLHPLLKDIEAKVKPHAATACKQALAPQPEAQCMHIYIYTHTCLKQCAYTHTYIYIYITYIYNIYICNCIFVPVCICIHYPQFWVQRWKALGIKAAKKPVGSPQDSGHRNSEFSPDKMVIFHTQ